MGEEKKTKQQLIAELGALESELEQSSAGGNQPALAGDAVPFVLAPKTRRGLLSWAAPVLLSLGTALTPGTARAASTDDFVPIRKGRCIPTPAASATPEPTGSPTTAATLATDAAPDEPPESTDSVPLTSAPTAPRSKS